MIANKKLLKKKDPDAPKRPFSPYMLFVTSFREQLKAKHPNATFSEVAKLMAESWKELPEEEKKVDGSPSILSTIFTNNYCRCTRNKLLLKENATKKSWLLTNNPMQWYDHGDGDFSITITNAPRSSQ